MIQRRSRDFKMISTQFRHLWKGSLRCCIYLWRHGVDWDCDVIEGGQCFPVLSGGFKFNHQATKNLWKYDYELINIVGADSLELTQHVIRIHNVPIEFIKIVEFILNPLGIKTYCEEQLTQMFELAIRSTAIAVTILHFLALINMEIIPIREARKNYNQSKWS